MKAIILAAGRGSRMHELTASSPKCLVKLKGRTLLDYQLSSLQQSGIKEIAIVCGYAKEKISDTRITTLFENPDWHATNMVRSLLSADAWLASTDCIVSYSDIFYHPDAVKLLINSRSINACIMRNCEILSEN